MEIKEGRGQRRGEGKGLRENGRTERDRGSQREGQQGKDGAKMKMRGKERIQKEGDRQKEMTGKEGMKEKRKGNRKNGEVGRKEE